MAKVRDDVVVKGRVYVETRFGEPIVEALKRLGCHWDRERNLWWVGAAKREELHALMAREGAGFDLRNDTDRAVRADQLEEQGRSEEAAELRKGAPQRDPHDIRLTGKGLYKGKTYYLGASTRDGARVLCLTLPGKGGRYLEFWADASQVQVIKTYQAREVWDGRRYSGRTEKRYTTLGSIADFIARQQRDRGTGSERVQCIECGSWHDADQQCRDCGGC